MHLRRLFGPSWFALIAVLALSAVGCRQPVPGDEEDNEALSGSCGVERWAVKTGTDAAASSVNMTPQDTTIAALRTQPVPAGLGSGSARFAGTAETQLWRLSNVTLTQYKLEGDSDYHLVLSDSSGNTMIAEIPSPSCVSGGPWAAAISASRAAMNAKFTVSGSFQTANVPVTLTGVGFFDLLHGQTGVAPNAIELHAVLSVCFPGSSVSGCSAATPDFTLGASPSSVTTAQGATGTSTVSVAAQGGFAGTVSLAASGLPTGASSSFSNSQVAAGGSATLTLSSGTAAAGTYAVTLTGTSGTLTHTASISWTISSGGTGGGGNAITNGDFETGSLSGWTTAGAASVTSTGAHGGSFAAQVGTTTAAGLNSIVQTLTVPAAGGPLAFWYRGVCADSITYTWAIATLKDNTTGTTTTLLPKTCVNTGVWTQVTSAALTAGHSMTLTLSSQGENFAGFSNYTLYDDVTLAGSAPAPDFTLAANPSTISTAQGASGASAISTGAVNGFAGAVSLSATGVPAGASASFSPTSISGAGSSTLTLAAGSAAAGSYVVTVTGTSGALSHSATLSWSITGSSGGNVVTNGDFETGSLSGWTSAGQTSIVSTGAHAGTSAARVGSTGASTDSSITQQVTLPAGSPQLTFWYHIVCPDTLQYDWATVTVSNTSGTVLATPLAPTCTNSGIWVQGSANLAAFAGQTVVLAFKNHDDNFAGDPTYTLFDDISISGGSVGTPDFTLAATSPGSTQQGGSATSTISLGASNGFASAVSLSASGLPSGASGSFSPASVTGAGTSTLTLASGTAAVGSYSVTVTGTSGALSHSAQISWTISATATPDFGVSLSSASVSSSGSAAATDTVTVTPVNGFASAVTLSVSGVPTGATGSFNPSSVSTGSGSSTLTLTPGTAATGTYSLTVSATGGNHTHTAGLSWTLSGGSAGALQTVFLIVMENHNWSSISGSSSAPYINGTLLPQASYALNYQNVPGLHPSLPNYFWLEAGTNFGITADGLPSSFHQSSTQHLVTLLQNAGVTWKSYQEDISGTTCPLTTTGQYAPKHNPMVFFDDVTNSNNSASANCISHVRPYTQLATDIQNNAVPRYNFITPNLCNDMHGGSGCSGSTIAAGDTWLSQQIPMIMASAAYRNGGAIFITWDESEGSNVPIGMIVLSSKAKGGGYTNNIAYTHSSTLRTMEEIFGVSPMLGGAATATDLSDLFTSFP